MTASEPQWTWLARIRRTQGRKGEVFADILTDFPEKFAERRELWLIADPDAARSGAAMAAPRAVELRAHWLHKGGIVLHFAGVDSISAGEALAGLIVAIPMTQRAELAEDAVYIGDLVGCTLLDVSGPEAVTVGRIDDVDRTAGPVALLVIHKLGAGEPDSKGAGTGDEILIPFAKSYLRAIDLAAKRVEMALPEGLIDLNQSDRN